jgi:hypothetical protein
MWQEAVSRRSRSRGRSRSANCIAHLGAAVTDADNKHRLAPTIEDKDIYKNVLDTRNFEISFFWQRSNYFLVLNSALALGFFSLKMRSYEYGLAVFGLLVSLLWCGVNLGSKFWQSVWENRLSKIEKKLHQN